MKRCASCGRDIPESATVCDLCERWASDHIAVGSASETHPATVPLLPPLTASPAVSSAASAVPPLSPSLTTPPPVQNAPKAGAPPAFRPRISRRELTFIAAAVVVAGFVTVGVLAMRGGAATTTVAATNVKPTPHHSGPSTVGVPSTQTWSAARSGYWTANQRHSIAFELPAENTVAIWLNYVRPLLVVRCMNKRTEAFVFTGSALKIEPETEDHTVTFRFDDQAMESTRWPDSAEHDALFAPDGAAFAERVLTAKTLRFGYTPHNAAAAEAQFQIGGLADLIAPAAKDCGWQK